MEPEDPSTCLKKPAIELYSETVPFNTVTNIMLLSLQVFSFQNPNMKGQNHWQWMRKSQLVKHVQ
jgi:hypothetical protein